jgi:hypothetical protein
LAVLFVAVGCILRLVQYFGNPSQWFDELLLSNNVASRSLTTLLTAPLGDGQVAPVGFLLLEKTATLIFGQTDLAFRSVALFCGITTAVVCFVFCRRFLDRDAEVIAAALVAFAAPLILYSGQAKQYSSDAAMSMILLNAVDRAARHGLSRTGVVTLSLLGAAAIAVSHAAVLVTVGLALALGWIALIERGQHGGVRLRDVTTISVVWALSSFAAFWIAESRLDAAERQFLHDYWSMGFSPAPFWQWATLMWPIRALARAIGGVESAGLWYPFRGVYLVLLFAGFVSIWRRHRRVTVILFGPVLVTLIAATARQYPFHDRLVLFLVPTLLIGIAQGIRVAALSLASLNKRLGTIVAMCLTLPALYPVLGSLPPYQMEDVKPVLAHLRNHWRPGDRLYVHHQALPAFHFYASTYDLSSRNVIFGTCRYDNPREYLTQLDQLRGEQRVWLLTSHDYYGEVPLMLGYLDAIGSQLDAYVANSRRPATAQYWTLTAAVYLYDLSGTSQRDAIRPHTYPLRLSHIPEFGC